MSFLDSLGLGTFWSKLKNYMNKEITCPQNIAPNSQFIENDWYNYNYSQWGTPTNYTANTNIIFCNCWTFYSSSDMTSFSINRYNESSGGLRIKGTPSADGTISIANLGYVTMEKYGSAFTARFDVTCVAGSAPVTLHSDINPASVSLVYSSGDKTLSAGESGYVFQSGTTAASTSGIRPVISFTAGSPIEIIIWGVSLYPVVINDPPSVADRMSYRNPAAAPRRINQFLFNVGTAPIVVTFGEKGYCNNSNEFYKQTYFFSYSNASTANKTLLLAKAVSNRDLGNGSDYTITGRVTITAIHTAYIYDALITLPIRSNSKNLVMGTPVSTVLAKVMPSGYIEPVFRVVNDSTNGKCIMMDLYPISGVSYGAEVVMDITYRDNYYRLYGGHFNTPILIDRT